MLNFRQILFALLLILILLSVLIPYFVTFHGKLSSVHEIWGVFGDYISGTLGVIISAIGTFLIYTTIKIQRGGDSVSMIFEYIKVFNSSKQDSLNRIYDQLVYDHSGVLFNSYAILKDENEINERNYRFIKTLIYSLIVKDSFIGKKYKLKNEFELFFKKFELILNMIENLHTSDIQKGLMKQILLAEMTRKELVICVYYYYVVLIYFKSVGIEANQSTVYKSGILNNNSIDSSDFVFGIDPRNGGFDAALKTVIFNSRLNPFKWLVQDWPE